LSSMLHRSDVLLMDNDKDSIVPAHQLRRDNKIATEAREQQRKQRLDAKIRMLRQGSLPSSSKVSEQVQRMLIKSRADGRKSLEMTDRIHFTCLVIVDYDDDDDDDNDNNADMQLNGMEAQHSGQNYEGYRYFSRQDTIGKVLHSFELPTTLGSDYVAELLVKQLVNDNSSSGEEATRYFRLPALPRLYECCERGWIHDFDTIVIRWFRHNRKNSTPSIDQTPIVVPPLEDDSVSRTDAPSELCESELNLKQDEVKQTQAENENCFVDESLTGAINDFSASGTKNSTKIRSSSKNESKSNAATVKVQQMKMKSCAVGDAKRIPVVSNRFYLNVVTVLMTTLFHGREYRVCSITPMFMSYDDSLQRLVGDLPILVPAIKRANVAKSEFEVLGEITMADNNGAQGYFRITDINRSFRNWLNEEQDHSIAQFDRIVVRYFVAP
jgi:hypothetical protein